MRSKLTAIGVITLFLAIGMTSQVSAQEELQRLSISGAVGVYSKYIVENGALWHKDPVFQGNVTLKFNRCGGYLDVWASKDFDNIGNYGEEVDYTVGWTLKDMNVGLSFLDYATVFGTQEPDFFRPFAEIPLPPIQFPGHRIQLYSRFEYYAATHDFDLNSGGWVMLGIRHCYEISKRWAFRHQAKMVYDGGVFGSMPGFLGMYDAGVDYALGSMTWNILSVKQSMISASMTDRENLTIVSTSVSAPIY